MDDLQSPTDNPGFINFGQEPEAPGDDYMQCFVYFYCEDKALKKKVFPEAWWLAKESETSENLSRDEVPFYEVNFADNLLG